MIYVQVATDNLYDFDFEELDNCLEINYMKSNEKFAGQAWAALDKVFGADHVIMIDYSEDEGYIKIDGSLDHPDAETVEQVLDNVWEMMEWLVIE